jgi:hypothetical protein
MATCRSYTREAFLGYAARMTATATTAALVQTGVVTLFPPAAVVPVGPIAGALVNEAFKTPCTIPYDMSGVPGLDLPPVPTQ